MRNFLINKNLCLYYRLKKKIGKKLALGVANTIEKTLLIFGREEIPYSNRKGWSPKNRNKLPRSSSRPRGPPSGAWALPGRSLARREQRGIISNGVNWGPSWMGKDISIRTVWIDIEGKPICWSNRKIFQRERKSNGSAGIRIRRYLQGKDMA